jgi:histidinol phosphatase-like PHP family hydrolase
MLDLTVDAHVHTAFSDGRDSVLVLVAAAEKAGLRELTLADRAGPDTAWLPAYLGTIQRAQQRTELVLRRGVEVEAIGTDGWLAFPGDLAGLEVVSVAVGRLPMPAGLAGPDTVRALVAAGSLRPADVAEMLVVVTARAMERVSRYAPTQLARALEFLTHAGIDERAIDDLMIEVLADACRRTGTVVEVSERHRSPTGRVARALAAGGVRVAPASDARDARELGRWGYVRQFAEELVG